MKPHSLLLGCATLFIVVIFAAQIRSAQPLVTDLLDAASQSNVVVTVSDWDHPGPCPLKYTNVLSNTNLFTPAEQELLRAVSLPSHRNLKKTVGNLQKTCHTAGE